MTLMIMGVCLTPNTSRAQTLSYPNYNYYETYESRRADLIAEIRALVQEILELDRQYQYQNQYNYNLYNQPPYNQYYQSERNRQCYSRYDCRDIDRRHSYRDYDYPDVRTDRATDIRRTGAEISGSVDMNDYRNGLVFFVYGEDSDLVEDIPYDFDQYDDIDEEGDDLQVIRIDSDLDDDDSYEKRLVGLDDNTDYYFSLCVEYDDQYYDEKRIICGRTREFETD